MLNAKLSPNLYWTLILETYIGHVYKTLILDTKIDSQPFNSKKLCLHLYYREIRAGYFLAFDWSVKDQLDILIGCDLNL